jgi:hypothetical protein
MSKERNVLLRITSFSIEAGEAAVGARPATDASDGGCRAKVVASMSEVMPMTGSRSAGSRCAAV